MNDIFIAKLNQIIQEFPKNVVWDEQYWNRIFQSCVEPYLKTLRDINRVINLFQFRYGMLYQETAFEDMVGITTIEVLEPELYKWIGRNKESVCGGVSHSMLAFSEKERNYREQYTKEFQGLGIEPEKAIKCISAMFPVFAKEVNGYYGEYHNSSDARSKMRVAHEERFELYFSMNLDDVKVSRGIIDSFIFSMDDNALEYTVKKINMKGDIVYFLKELWALVDSIPYDRLGKIAMVMIDLQGTFQDENGKYWFSLPAVEIAHYCIMDILKMLKTAEERNQIICSAVDQLNMDGLGAIARIIRQIENGYGKFPERPEKQKDQIISSDQLHELERLYLDKLQEFSRSESFVDLSDFRYIVHLWELLDKESAQNYVYSITKDDFHKLRYMCAMASRWHGTNGSGWSFNALDYISNDEIYELIRNYDKQKLDRFSDVEQIKLASFFLTYQKDDDYLVNEQEARNLLNNGEVFNAYVN